MPAEMVGDGRKPVLYPNVYAWYILVGAIDVILTTHVMLHHGAIEVNTIADRLIARFGLWGLIGLKFGSMILVIAICEYVGARRVRTGRRLAEWAVGLSAIPVVVTLIQVIGVVSR